MLRTHLDEHLTEAQLLRTLRVEGRDQTPSRTWKFPRSPDALPLPKIAWPVTIVDVAHCLPDREAYNAQVKQWARTTLQYMYVPR